MKLFASLALVSILAASAYGQGLINRRAPSFSLPDSNFTQFDILDYRGKWLLLEFMMTGDTNCPMCKDITKKLDALQLKHGSKLAVLSIANTPPETQDTIKKFIADTKSKTPIVFDASMVAMAYFKATPARPAIDTGHVFAIDPSGTIVQDWAQALVMGPSFSSDVDKLIARGTGSASKEEPAAKAKANSKK
ncbi:MAG: TlpA disulfide reductase family protein [Bryobacteraceae bacterium]